MSFFQNVFASDFEGNWVLGDRQHIPKFVCPHNAGRGDEIVAAWEVGPYNLAGNDASGNSKANLVIVYALREFKNWASLSVAIAGSTPATTTAAEIVTLLNADATFAERFEASYTSYQDSSVRRVVIRQRRPVTEFRFYIQNGTAEEALRFNMKAGVAELPTYFARHTMDNRFTYEDSQNHLVLLDAAGNAVDQAVINNAVDAYGRSKGFVHTTVQADWQLLEGRSGIFQFQKGPGTAVNSTKTTIQYSTGAKVGDLAKKIITKLDASSVIVEQYELPYTLTLSDLITPP